jgi:hypothetical protein
VMPKDAAINYLLLSDAERTHSFFSTVARDVSKAQIKPLS